MMQGPGDHAAITVCLMVKPIIKTRQDLANALLGCGMVVRRITPIRRQHRIKREGNTQTDQHGTSHCQCEWTEPFTWHPRHKRDRNKYRDDREGCGSNSEANFCRAFQRCFAAVSSHLHVTDNVLTHHNRIVD